MLDAIAARWRQGYRTMAWPDGPPPELPRHFAGWPLLEGSRCAADCRRCEAACPTGAIDAADGVGLDVGRCLFCRECAAACPAGVIRFGREHRMAAVRRQDLVVGAGTAEEPPAAEAAADIRRLFGRSLKLRQVSAGGCNACEADANVLTTPAWDMGRFGIEFVASPRHADGLLVTGPVTTHMRLALEKTYRAVPAPKLVIASGACAIGGGPYVGHDEVCDGVAAVLPVDLFVPGCPPHPLTLLDGLLRFLGRSRR